MDDNVECRYHRKLLSWNQDQYSFPSHISVSPPRTLLARSQKLHTLIRWSLDECCSHSRPIVPRHNMKELLYSDLVIGRAPTWTVLGGRRGQNNCLKTCAQTRIRLVDKSWIFTHHRFLASALVTRVGAGRICLEITSMPCLVLATTIPGMSRMC